MTIVPRKCVFASKNDLIQLKCCYILGWVTSLLIYIIILGVYGLGVGQFGLLGEKERSFRMSLSQPRPIFQRPKHPKHIDDPEPNTDPFGKREKR